MKMLSDMGSIPIASTIVSTIRVAFTAWIVFFYYIEICRNQISEGDSHGIPRKNGYIHYV